MRITKLEIHNLFGISMRELDGKSVELAGPKGSGKTSVLDSIRYALTNRSDRDYVIRQGADEGEIIIETDTGLCIDRKTRTNKADAIKVKDGSMLQSRPAEYLAGIFTPLQLNPVEFCAMSRQEKNRVILSLIEFAWDMNWIADKFREIPQGIDYSKHILEVLSDIQAESGTYYRSRQELNSRKLHIRKSVEDIALTIPAGYDYDKWNAFQLGPKYSELERIKENNSIIQRAQAFRDNYNDKKRGLEAERDIAIAAADREIQNERQGLTNTIERLRAEIKAAEDRLTSLDGKLIDKRTIAEGKYREAIAKLDKDIGTAAAYADKKPEPIDSLQDEIKTAEAMRLHLNEYARMRALQQEIEELQAESDELTRKIELARELPGEILRTATIPIEGLTVDDGIPLINGLPISNLSDGELLELCVDITVSRPGALEIILIDGAERLDGASRERLYAKCKAKGLQLIATRVTDAEELEVIEL